jgi:hypothetical protein
MIVYLFSLFCRELQPCQLEPGLEDEDFAHAGRRLDRLSDTVFRRYGVPVRSTP